MDDQISFETKFVILQSHMEYEVVTYHLGKCSGVTNGPPRPMLQHDDGEEHSVSPKDNRQGSLVI
jgi:hypothetical protein